LPQRSLLLQSILGNPYILVRSGLDESRFGGSDQGSSVRPLLRMILFSFAVGVTAALASCGGDEEGRATAEQPSPSPAPPAATGSNSAPTLAGSPPIVTLQGRNYAFRPSASDAENDRLTFTIENRPAWASFNTATGRLSGRPSPADIGSFAEIRIAVTDGVGTTSLPPFSISVVGTASGSATLSWLPPTVNTDGTALTNLSGYRIHWGTQAGDYANSVSVDNAGLSSYTVDQLTPATWHFVVTAVNSNGVQSRLSNPASKPIH
jgi:hypothetical protein